MIICFLLSLVPLICPCDCWVVEDSFQFELLRFRVVKLGIISEIFRVLKLGIWYEAYMLFLGEERSCHSQLVLSYLGTEKFFFFYFLELPPTILEKPHRTQLSLLVDTLCKQHSNK